MRATGLEPAHRKTPDPKSGASANSATPAYLILLSFAHRHPRRRVSACACNMDVKEVLINKTFVTSTNPSRKRSVFLVLLHLLTCSLHLPKGSASQSQLPILPFATSAYPSQAVVCSVSAVLRQLLTCSLYLPPAAVAVATTPAYTNWAAFNFKGRSLFCQGGEYMKK